MENEYNLSRIGKLLRENKVRKTHDMIVYLFQLWLEKKGVPLKNMIILDEYKGLSPDIIVFNNNKVVSSVWEIIEPDPQWDINNETVREKLEKMLIRAYARVYSPRVIVLSDGMSMFIYDSSGKLLYRISDLSKIDRKKEKQIEEIIL